MVFCGGYHGDCSHVSAVRVWFGDGLPDVTEEKEVLLQDEPLCFRFLHGLSDERNGAGLASICILCTMVLVMISSTVCLYIGSEDSLRTRYPRNITLDTIVSGMSMMDSDQTDMVRTLSQQAALSNGQQVSNVLDYRVATFAGYLSDGRITLDGSNLYSFQLSGYADVWQVFLVPLEDYNRLMGQNETLAPNEALLYTTKEVPYVQDSITIEDGAPLAIKEVVPDFVDNGMDAMQIIPSLYLFVPDMEQYCFLDGKKPQWR